MTGTPKNLAAQADPPEPVYVSAPIVSVPWTVMTLVPSGDEITLWLTFTLHVVPDPATNGLPTTGLAGYQMNPITGLDAQGAHVGVYARGLIEAQPPGQVVTFVQPVTVKPSAKSHFLPSAGGQLVPATSSPILLTPVNPGSNVQPVTVG